MHPRSAPVQIIVPLPAADYRIYASAVRRLRRVMGSKAPDQLALFKFSLQGRDAVGIADDYLDSVHWPHAAGRMVSLLEPSKPGRQPARMVGRASRRKTVPRLPAGSIRVPADPSRN